MRDVVYLLVIVAFFALTVAYVRWADHLVGEDEAPAPDPTIAPEPIEVGR